MSGVINEEIIRKIKEYDAELDAEYERVANYKPNYNHPYTMGGISQCIKRGQELHEAYEASSGEGWTTISTISLPISYADVCKAGMDKVRRANASRTKPWQWRMMLS